MQQCASLVPQSKAAIPNICRCRKLQPQITQMKRDHQGTKTQRKAFHNKNLVSLCLGGKSFWVSAPSALICGFFKLETKLLGKQHAQGWRRRPKAACRATC